MKKKRSIILYVYALLVVGTVVICLLYKNTQQPTEKTTKQAESKVLTTTLVKYSPYTPFIIIDKDGYTNIREQPNANSKIVGKIYKYQLFFTIDDYCGSEMFATDSWEPIQSDGNPTGYIYKKNIMYLGNLPFLDVKGKNDFELSSDSCATIVRANDSIQVIMRLQPYSRQNHQGWIHGGGSDAYNTYVVLQQSGTKVKEVEVSESEHGGIETEIKDIEIIYNGQKTILPKDRIYNYCDLGSMRACLGSNGELYLGLSGGGDGAWYMVWFSIVEGEIVYETMVDSCW